MAIADYRDDTGLHPLDREDQVATAIKAVVRAFDAWELSNAQAQALFDVSPTTWSRMRGGVFNGRLDQDKVTRASLIVGIYKALRLLFNGPLATGWPLLPNKGAPYEGMSPVSYMIRGGIPAMAEVRQHLDALRGGL